MNRHDEPKRIAKNESLRRDDNERLEAHNASIHWVNPPYADWRSECANESCSQPVRLSVREYDEVRRDPTHFVIVPSDEHVSAEVERIVRRTDRYWVVEKIGAAAEASKDLDSEPAA